MTDSILNKMKLFAYIIVDDIQVDLKILTKAKEGDGYSLAKIGEIYYSKKEYKKAIGWYHLAAKNNNAFSQVRVGYMYHYGKGVSVDYKLAMQWYLKGHENGNISAANYIGFFYTKGYGVDQNDKTALEWYLKAANEGYCLAQNNVGAFYEHGYGVEVDEQYALEWYEKSAEQGLEEAKNGIKRLNKKGVYLDEKQKRYREIEKTIEKQQLRISSLKDELESLKKQLMETEKEKRQKDNEITLLNEENQSLRLSNITNTQPKVYPDKETIYELGQALYKMAVVWEYLDSFQIKKSYEKILESEINLIDLS